MYEVRFRIESVALARRPRLDWTPTVRSTMETDGSNEIPGETWWIGLKPRWTWC